MNTKSIIYLGMGVGSTLGGMLPMLWGDSALSLSAVFLSAVGGFIGIAVGYKLAN